MRIKLSLKKTLTWGFSDTDSSLTGSSAVVVDTHTLNYNVACSTQTVNKHHITYLRFQTTTLGLY